MGENELSKNKEKDILDNQISIGEEKSEAIAHKDSALKRLDISFNKHIEIGEYKKSNILAYWIKDFSKYHDEENTFDLSSFKTFKRGDIIKVNLGFNIGKELGGLHYCIVLNKNDNPYNGTLNVIPLSSAKEYKKFNTNTCIDLGDELYILLNEKLIKEMDSVQNMFLELKNNKDIDSQQINIILQKMKYLEKMQDELSKMKHGSFALVHQMTAISKQRIFKSPLLANIKISNESLDLIDKKIIKLFTR